MNNRRIIITEAQMDVIIEQIILETSIFEAESLDEIKDILKRAIKKGIVITSATIAGIVAAYNLDKYAERQLEDFVQQEKQEVLKPVETWRLAADDVLATVYNAIPSQCNKDVKHTASNFKLNLNDVLSHRIIAMERTFMQELGIKYGDVVRIEGTGDYDGEWQVQDTMNKRFAGQHKIDILVPKHIKRGKWNNVKLYVLNDKSKTDDFKSNFAQ